MSKHPAESILQRITSAETVDFVELASIAGLDIRKDFAGADLKNAVLSKADLRGCNFSRADFTSADLSYADLTEANLQGANFSLANLQYADLRSANLENAIFTEANLSGATLLYANIKDANFREVRGIEPEDLERLRAMMELDRPDGAADRHEEIWRKSLEQKMTVRALEASIYGCRQKLTYIDSFLGREPFYEREVLFLAMEVLAQLDASHLSQQDTVVNEIRTRILQSVKERRVNNKQFGEEMLELEHRLRFLKSRY
jgi:uncharacterized protein YjbI with pentapeptide repeats